MDGEDNIGMLFGDYIKLCRTNSNLTQEELANNLYSFDNIFKAIEANTISRWERNIISPTYQKQIKIIEFFQKNSLYILPYSEYIEKIEPSQATHILGKSKEHIQNLPTDIFLPQDIELQKVNLTNNTKEAFKMAHYIFQQLTDNYFDISYQQLQEWSSYTSSNFTISTIHQEFCGSFFTIKLKPDVYKEVIHLKKEPKRLRDNDFASPTEKGSELIVSFYAYHKDIAQMLFANYYMHLIKNQLTIQDIGTTPLLKGGIKLVEKMHLQYITSSQKLNSYSASLKNVLLNKDALKVIFNPATRE